MVSDRRSGDLDLIGSLSLVMFYHILLFDFNFCTKMDLVASSSCMIPAAKLLTGTVKSEGIFLLYRLKQNICLKK